nr:hypothetical protein CUMW_239710 [Ipomoea batatas]GMC87569.1 hypothetical protein CUMW_239710 [Ipomoea batatas]
MMSPVFAEIPELIQVPAGREGRIHPNVGRSVGHFAFVFPYKLRHFGEAFNQIEPDLLKNPMKDRYYKMHLLHPNIKWRDNQKNQKLMLCPCRRWCAVGLSAFGSWCFAGDERETDGFVTNFVAKTLNLELDPNVWRVESSKDSSDVAQNLVSPSMGRNSQWRRVSAMAVACGEAAEKEKKFRR